MTYLLLSKYRSELMGIAMLLVMLFHASDFEFHIAALDTVKQSGYCGVDIFIFVSAIGLSMSLCKKKQEYVGFIQRRAKRVLPAYYAVMLPYIGIKILLGYAPLSSLIFNSSLLYYWVKCEDAFNWYISAIMLFYAITPLLWNVINRAKRRAVSAALCIAVGLLVIVVLIHDNYWSYLDFFYRVPIFIMGLLVGIYIYESRQFTLSHGVFWLIWFALGIVYRYFYANQGVLPCYVPLAPMFLFIIPPLCMVVCALFKLLPLGALRAVLSAVGERSLEIYLLNVSFFAETDFLRRFIKLDKGNYGYWVVIIVLNIICGFILHKLLKIAGEYILKKKLTN